MIQIDYLTGTVKLPRIKYVVIGGKVKRRWWFGYREEWWVQSDLLSLGPYDSFADAWQHKIKLDRT